jgi:protoporphyrinogen oxidase
MDTALPNQWIKHVREAWIWVRERFIPYPFQYNICHLPENDLLACVDGLLNIYRDVTRRSPSNFREWLLRSFGQGLCDIFMFPYNWKVWAYPPESMNVQWMGERVATVDVPRAIRNVIQKQKDVEWGPNAIFRFPSEGGTGAIWEALWQRLPDSRRHLNKRVTRIEPERKTVYFADGDEHCYGTLISTIPLDQLVHLTAGMKKYHHLANRLKHSSVHIVGVGLKGDIPPELQAKSWIYFPDSNVPFYRVTVFSNYSPANTPPGYWALMAEVSESPAKPVDSDSIGDQVVAAMRNVGLIVDTRTIVSLWHHRAEYAYPTPFLGRDKVIDKLHNALMPHGIYSRGRFGAWKYEIGNMDHSVLQGAHCVDELTGTRDALSDKTLGKNGK